MNKTTGELVPGRCRSTNLCGYCARLAAVENAEVLALDALLFGGPNLCAVLTTRTATRDHRAFHDSRRQVMRALQRRWPARAAWILEFTTGYGPRSGGRRRPHWNVLLKGIPSGDLDAAAEVIRRVWCERVDALPEHQYVGEVAHVGGLMRYLTLHFQKDSQTPPKGWRGHRFTHTRGRHAYFAEGVQAMRERAREQLRYRRTVHRISTDAAGVLLGDEIHELASLIRDKERQIEWGLVQVGDVEPPTQAQLYRRRMRRQSQGENVRTPTVAPPGVAHRASRHPGSAAALSEAT